MVSAGIKTPAELFSVQDELLKFFFFTIEVNVTDYEPRKEALDFFSPQMRQEALAAADRLFDYKITALLGGKSNPRLDTLPI